MRAWRQRQPAAEQAGGHFHPLRTDWEVLPGDQDAGSHVGRLNAAADT
jgi:hypothetical protein